MTGERLPTSARHRRVQWKLIDRALIRFSTESLLTLLEAALLSPTCSRVHDHLLLLWTRVARSAHHAGAVASARDLPMLVQTAAFAAPGRGVLTDREPNDPRARVRFKGLLVHPGELDHPLLVLRNVELTGHAADEQLVEEVGFGLGDVLELALRYSDRRIRELLPAWPAAEEQAVTDRISCSVTQEEVNAVAAAERDCLDEVADGCAHPERARRALAWLTTDVGSLKLRYCPTGRLLGPVLAVRAHGRRIPVPASEALDAITACAELLLTKSDPGPEVSKHLQDLTVTRVAEVLGLSQAPRPDLVCRISGPSLRLDVAIVSALAGGELSARLEAARAVLAEEAAAGRERLVVYAGPGVLGPEVVTDTLMLHVEELAEMLAEAGGDRMTLALFVMEMTSHPGVDAIAFHDALDAWIAWRRLGTLLPPGAPRQDVAVVPPHGLDVSWERAAIWSPVDQVLEDAGLPASLHWTAVKLVGLPAGAAGRQADLHHFGTQPISVAVATAPPLAVMVPPSTPGEALLDLPALTGLADAVRTTITADPVIAEHFTLPDATPFLLQLTQTSPLPNDPPDDEEPSVEPLRDGVRIAVAADAQHAVISIVLDAELLATFTGNGGHGHQVVGRALHHLTADVRRARGADDGVDLQEFLQAWNRAHPVLAIGGYENFWPATTPPYDIPDGVHVQVRAMRTAAAAIRRAGVPVGTWRGPDAYRPGGPAEQLLHALEDALAEEVQGHAPDLLTELARHLNAAWCTRARGHQELLVNLSAPWAENWTEEARDRHTKGATSTSALHLLLHQAIVTPPVGTRPADLLAVADLVALPSCSCTAGSPPSPAAAGCMASRSRSMRAACTALTNPTTTLAIPGRTAQRGLRPGGLDTGAA
ncbi:hypothetical protein [Streptomyces sp. NPDC052107]|uniref:hypothetical protein n=1 Tax=Streptomyces sp. NPDC052107 TaxID=3155632 RepID=UPI003431DEEF